MFRRFPSLKLFFPFLFWLYLFRSFLTGQALAMGEAFGLYSHYKFYFNNLWLGVFPLWEPYFFWGTVGGSYLQVACIFNPVFFLMPLLHALGMNFYFAFVATYAVYYFLGSVGFYRLAKIITDDDLSGWAAYVLLLFSSLGFPLFTYPILVLMYVPGVWFFYFWIRFLKAPDKAAFVGMTFCLMLIATTYLPFYFLTTFLAFVIVVIVGNIRQLRRYSGNVMGFLKRNPATTLFCILALLLSCFPILASYQNTVRHEVVVPSRHSLEATKSAEGAHLNYGDAAAGGLSARMSADDLFSNLDQIQYDADGFFYVPVFAYLILLLSVVTTANKRVIMLLGLTVFTFLLSLSSAAGLHRFLYDHVFYFQLFRNCQYFTPFLLSAFILLTVEQLRLLKAWAENAEKWKAFIFVVIIHLGFFLFLRSRENVILSSYLTIVASAPFLSWYVLARPSGSRKFIYVWLFVVMIIQPSQVLSAHNVLAKEFDSPVMRETILNAFARPQFSFTRPKTPDAVAGIDFERIKQRYFEPQYFFYRYEMSLRDSPGFFIPYTNGLPIRWSYELSQQAEPKILQDYIHYKFWVYDGIMEVKDSPGDWQEFERILKGEQQTAIIAPGHEDTGNKNSSPEKPVAFPVQENTSQFHVDHFDVNAIFLTTEFPTKKFLVYTDSFHSGWKAFINGKVVPVYRANIAFKGIWLPAGNNKVSFRYLPWGGQRIYWVMILTFWGIFIYLLRLQFLKTV